MSELKSKPPLSFWIISILALIWNISGVITYTRIIFWSDEIFNGLSVIEKEYLTTIPVMTSVTYAIYIFAGLFGSLLLLLKSKEAALVLLVAFIAQIINQHYFLVTQETIEITSNNSTYPIISISISFLLVVFACRNHKEDYFN